MRLVPLLALMPILFGVGSQSAAAEQLPPISLVAFGSCVKQDKPQPIWESIVAARPQLFLLLGDNIYGDSLDMDVLRAKYAMLGQQSGYRQLKALCPILATWDDHDYGANDAGAEYPQKEASQKLFNEFFDVPADSPRRQRPGVYDAAILGPPGQRLQIILLDTRYFRGPLKKWPVGERGTPGPYAPNTDQAVTFLGEVQWKWFAAELRKPAEIRIIASSVEVVAEEHGYEYWANFPAERRRLLEMITETHAGGVLFVSGDRHLAEISKLPKGTAGAPYDLYDITSSSLNAPGGGTSDEPNRFRLGDVYRQENFGTLAIKWADDPTITISVHDIHGQTVRTQSVRLSDLQAQ